MAKNLRQTIIGVRGKESCLISHSLAVSELLQLLCADEQRIVFRKRMLFKETDISLRRIKLSQVYFKTWKLKISKKVSL